MKFWKTKPTCWRSLRISPCWCFSGLLASISISPTLIRPPLGSSSRFRQRSRVVLPEPLGPMMATTSPGSTVRSMPLSTSWPLKALVRLRTVIISCPAHAG
ncbi:hypothetical protein D3C72_1698320 [compost metagenome]